MSHHAAEPLGLRVGDGFELSAVDTHSTPGFDGSKRDGEEALNRFAAERIDLVVLDIMLPKLDGLTLIGNLLNLTDFVSPYLNGAIQGAIIVLAVVLQREGKARG